MLQTAQVQPELRQRLLGSRLSWEAAGDRDYPAALPQQPLADGIADTAACAGNQNGSLAVHGMLSCSCPIRCSRIFNRLVIKLLTVDPLMPSAGCCRLSETTFRHCTLAA